ncbi:MAG TPA: NADH-quinone oxidoreductase subunit NuoN [Aeromicrobium sp.]|nr:NADH-quinone oxidoreductase subunit NuoN [Aeromicrobium sp.]
MTPIAPPHVEYALIAPILIVSGGAVLGTLAEAFVPRQRRFSVQALIAFATVLATLADSIYVYAGLPRVGNAGRGRIATEGALAVDGPGVLTWAMLSVFAVLSLALFAERRLESGLSAFTGRAADAPGSPGEAEARAARLEHSEVFPLALFALLGMMVFATANDLLTLFVALEVLSLPLYVLCGLARRRRLLSQEAALKYFLLGAFSSAFFAYGIALAYGYAGGVRLADIDRAVQAGANGQPLLLAAIALMAVGLLFKIGAVPFHAWTPDVYQGSPTPVTAFMAAGTKAAAVIALMRVLFVAFGGASSEWRPLLWGIAVVTMLLGSLVAIAQTDVKRMLGYSSVAHAGFLLVGITGAFAAAGRVSSVSAVLFYLAVYGVASIGAFAVVTLVRDSADRGGGEANHLARWAGLGQKSPLLAGAFALFLLSFAGIPLTSGFIGKMAVFSTALNGGYWPLVVIAVMASAVAAYFYARVIVLMFFTEPVGDGPDVAARSPLTTVVIGAAALVTLVLGLIPGPALEFAQHAGLFVG